MNDPQHHDYSTAGRVVDVHHRVYYHTRPLGHFARQLAFWDVGTIGGGFRLFGGKLTNFTSQPT